MGLAYDALDPGVYASDVVDEVFLIPYPSQGRDALLVTTGITLKAAYALRF